MTSLGRCDLSEKKTKVLGLTLSPVGFAVLSIFLLDRVMSVTEFAAHRLLPYVIRGRVGFETGAEMFNFFGEPNFKVIQLPWSEKSLLQKAMSLKNVPRAFKEGEYMKTYNPQDWVLENARLDSMANWLMSKTSTVWDLMNKPKEWTAPQQVTSIVDTIVSSALRAKEAALKIPDEGELASWLQQEKLWLDTVKSWTNSVTFGIGDLPRMSWDGLQAVVWDEAT